MMCLWPSYEKNMKKNIFLASFKSMKESDPELDSEPEPDPRQNVTDPQHCLPRVHVYTYDFDMQTYASTVMGLRKSLYRLWFE